jgi:hypothetical protein
MSQVVDWGDVSSNRGGGSKGEIFLRLKPGNEYQVRLVGKPIKFQRYYVSGKGGERGRSAITNGGEDCVIRNTYNLNPSERYAINVIDRGSNQIMVMEMPVTLFKDVSNWASARKKDPGKNDSVDFHIKVERQNPNDPRTTRYHLTPLDNSPFTEEEKELIGEKGKNLHNLLEIFRAVPQDQIEEKLGLKEAASQPATAAVSAPTSGDDADDDDLPF